MIKRYSVKSIENIFSDSSKHKKWLKIEILLLKYLAKKDILNEAVVNEFEEEALIVPSKIRTLEKKTNHDVVAFINHVSNTAKPSIKKWLHYGLTSSDLVDTGNSMMFREANAVFIKAAYDLLLRLRRLSKSNKDAYLLSRDDLWRVNGITSFGYKIALCYEDMREAVADIERHRKYVECVSISGSMGICSHIDPELQDFVAAELDLYSADCSTQVLSRDRYYKHFWLMNRLIQSIHNLCQEIRLLARTEVGEVYEFFYGEQVGSSSMPHKRNPITLENICGLCRLFNSYCYAASRNTAIWFERDISHSSLDRVVFLDAFSTAVQIIKRFYKVMAHLSIDKKRMMKNIRENDYLAFRNIAFKELLKRSKCISVGEINQHIETIRKDSVDSKISFQEAMMRTDVVDYLGEETIKNIFDPAYQLKSLDVFYERIFLESEKRSRFDTVFYEKEEIINAIESVALRLNCEYGNRDVPVKLIVLREGTIVFLSHLLTKLNFPVELKSINSSLIKHLLKNKKPVHNDMFDLVQADVKGRDVLIIDDVLENGEFIKSLKKRVGDLGAKKIKTLTLFATTKKEAHKDLDMFGLLLPTTVGVAGFGIDSVYGEFRNYAFIGKLKLEHL